MGRDDVCEVAFARKRGLLNGYSLGAALERARRHGPLLQGISVYCFPSVVELRELPLLVAAAGGTWLKVFPTFPGGDSILLLGENKPTSPQEEKCRKEHAVYHVELLREGACLQKL